jgi:Fe-S cluster assembly ATPase SufC
MELRRLIEQRAAYDRLMKDFQTQLAQVQEGAEAEGRTTVAATLQTLEPEQAKLLLLDMLDKQETEEVVILLIGMDERRRAGILGEFQTPDEIAKIAEVLRLIRQGHPKAAIAEEVSQRVDPQNLGTK